MKLFENYTKDFDSILSKNTKITPELLKNRVMFSANAENSIRSLNESVSDLSVQMVNKAAPIDGPKVLFNYDKQHLEKYFGRNKDAFSNITIGPHPDFKYLQNSDYLNHHCVSVFVDIKGSTRLIEKYSLLEVRLIKDSLLTLAIQVANQFGGHVHRLQGDGIFLQFVRKDGTANDAVINALNAVSLITQFVSVDLKNIMLNYGLKPLKIRAGIDYGNDEKVLWSYYGIAGCEELTTTSLHTDMAAKLQAKAYDNSILIGGNVKDILDLKKDFYSFFENQESKEKVYYISSQFTYPFYVFNWKEYLYSLPFIWKQSGSDNLEIKEKDFTIECFISDDDGSNQEKYYPNSKSIPKGKNIEFKLFQNGKLYHKKDFEKIEWHAFNSGSEAESEKQLQHDFNKNFNNKTICSTGAAYLGHHYVQCKIMRGFQENMKFTFPIFVQ